MTSSPTARPSPRRPAGRPTRQQAERLPQTILEAAWELFVADGYRALSMEAIARHAGVSKRTIYDRFTDKDALLAALVSHAIGQWRAQAATAHQDVADDLWLDAVIDHLLTLLSSREVAALGSFMTTEGRGLTDAETAVKTEREASMQVFARQLASRRDDFSDLDRATSAGESLLALLQGYATIFRDSMAAGGLDPSRRQRVGRECRALLALHAAPRD